MQKNKLLLLVLVNFILLIILAVCLFFLKKSNDNAIVYVDKVKLFEGFKMTNEMKSVGEKEFEKKRLVVDSLYANLQKEDQKSNSQLVQEFVQKRDELDQFNQSFAIQESDKIWKRINSYVKEFSQEKGYKMIIGSENNNEVLYADEKIDVTPQLLLYINKKYEGFK